MTPLKTVVSKWIADLPVGLLQTIGVTSNQLLDGFPKSYSIYPPMLLLPAHSFQSESWMHLFQNIDASSIKNLHETIAKAMKVTHIAINAAIPPIIGGSIENNGSSKENILRSPTNLQPLYGDFGTLITSRPTANDFNDAFWVTVKQNGIHQVWAPLYTMFSRGNISEKARILHMESLRPPLLDPPEFTAVDLHAGIGYFTFSYAAAGAAKVLCWELNPWSVEGLRRGAEVNKWATEIVAEDDPGSDVAEKQIKALETNRIVGFQESNIEATRRIAGLRKHIPPIRHINCGLLPSSRGSWKTAVEALDPEYGGWIHVHENIAVKDIPHVKDEIVAEIHGLAERMNKSSLDQDKQSQMQVICEHIEQVKSYAPGVMHCVLDILVPPRLTIGRKPR